MSREITSYLRLLHGTYNTVIILLFIYQGILGLKIMRSERKAVHIIRRHRKTGPVIAVLGISGFIAGMTVTFLEWGRILKYPYHFITGLIIVFLIIVVFIISRKIKGPEPYWRKRHFAVGVLIIVLYLVQAFLGLGLLL